MFDSIDQTIMGKLWEHQRESLKFAISRLNESDSPCLIRMPTGTGKTGIIACLTRLSNDGSSLVLTPWANLRNQMITDLERDFWRKVDVTPEDRDVVAMFPSTAKRVVKAREPKVIVCTFATLNSLRLDDYETYRDLAAAVSLVVVDEGHYEPAVEWGKSVKGLRTKTLLLTATPYRNDLKLFRITDVRRFTHHFTHKDAVAGQIIRELNFETLSSPISIPSLSREFGKRWKEAKRTRRLPSQRPRAIVCCAGASDIEEAVNHLRRAGIEAIGIHEQFADSTSAYLHKEVPDPHLAKAEVWVHQNKLTEGLDDHRFCCLALFTRIRNDRKLVQQIGRVLRRDNADRSSMAILLSPPEFSPELEWKAYLEFETNFGLLEPQHFRSVVETLLNAQPEVEYFDGRFRRRFRPADLSQRPQVIIPPSVLVRVAGEDFMLADYIDECTDTLNTEDAVILGPDLNAPCQQSQSSALWVYASVRNSRFLQTASLYEVKLESHCVVVADGLVFMTDSRGNFPEEYVEEHSQGVPPQRLARYLDKTFRPTHVSVDSAIPYDTVLRGADLRGHNLLSIPASLTDRVQICQSARGTSRDSGRRYVGMSSGRVRKEVSEEERRNFDLETFVAWAESTAKILNSRVMSSALFRRYMPTCAPPTNPVPRTICLDMLRMDVSLTLVDGRKCHLRNSSCDIQESTKDNRKIYTCSFALEGPELDGDPVVLRIYYQPAKHRFWFNKQEGPAVRVIIEGDDESPNKSLAEFLNQKQDIVLIGLDGGEVVYQGRNFYKIDYHHAQHELLGLIQRPTNTLKCATEKGTSEQLDKARRSQETKFPASSIFRVIAEHLVELPFSEQLLICDDMGTECADFVAANLNECQLAFIHAKVGTGTRVSASAFHEVVAQAMKNLAFMAPNGGVPSGVNSWKRSVKWRGTGIRRLYRAPNGVPVGLQLWDKLTSEIIRTSNPRLFVVLVTAGCCDLPELTDAVEHPTRSTPQVAQLLHLLDGLNGYARQLGVRLVVYDIPYELPDSVRRTKRVKGK